MKYKIIEKMACTIVQLDCNLRKAAMTADYLMTSHYQVSEIRQHITMSFCTLVLDKCDTDKLKETLDFYIENNPDIP